MPTRKEKERRSPLLHPHLAQHGPEPAELTFPETYDLKALSAPLSPATIIHMNRGDHDGAERALGLE